MSKLKSPTSARKLADRIIEGLNIPYLINEKLLIGTVSIGIAIYPMDGTSTEELLKNADTAMYNAKKSGKNTYRFYTEKLSKEQHREAKIESYLPEALKKDEFTLFYQPQYNLLTQEIIGAEILLRWHNERLGEISPAEFIPVAEQNNLMIGIGDWVLQKACEQAKLWREQYKRELLFSINVSAIQFKDNNFYLNFKKTVESYNFPPHSLGIEISENLLIENNEDINIVISNINMLGVRISLDDFSMSYSSLKCLKMFPLNILKIDKLFVADILNEKDNVLIIDTIIKLAQELGITIVAEGIENKKQLNYLISKECHLGQGFFLSKPLPAAEFEKIAYSVTYLPEEQ
jgi:EAL domain-containing protein (putative c-di-GMP-specific phosphodiesterase class I)